MITNVATIDGPAFEVNSLKWLKENAEYFGDPYRHTCPQIVWIKRGIGHYCIDTDRFDLSVNTIYFVPAGRVQQWHVSEDPTGYVISFSRDIFHLSIASPSRSVSEEMIAGFAHVNIVAVRDDKIENMMYYLLNEMTQELVENRRLRTEFLAALLKVFLIHLRRMQLPGAHDAVNSRMIAVFNEFNAHLDKFVLTKRSVAEYAHDLSVTPGYLTGVVKRFTGLSASRHIQQRRVMEAKRLAIYSGENMKCIAYKLGFEDSSHFSKFFKNVTGVNFSEFKKTGIQN